MASGCRKGQSSSGGDREAFSSLALYFCEPEVHLQKHGVLSVTQALTLLVPLLYIVSSYVFTIPVHAGNRVSKQLER